MKLRYIFAVLMAVFMNASWAQVRGRIPLSADPTIVRTFTTSVGTHYFNGSQLVTCTPTGACAAQWIKVKDIVPYLSPSSGWLLVLIDDQQMQVCNMSLEGCQPVFKESIPGAKLLTVNGEVMLQTRPVQCGYTPTAGNNCGGFKKQPKGPMVDRAMAFVGQQGMTQQMVLAKKTTGEYLTTRCSAGMSGCSVIIITHPVEVNTTLERFMDSRGDGSWGDLTDALGTGELLVEDDSSAYGQYERAVSSNASLMDEYNAQTTVRCRQTVCDYNRTVDNNGCMRLTSGSAVIGLVGSGLFAAGVGVMTDGAGFWPAYKLGTAVAGGTTGAVGSTCGYIVATKQNNCYTWCETTFGPGAWYPGQTSAPSQ
jgi:hypothetical protein